MTQEHSHESVDDLGSSWKDVISSFFASKYQAEFSKYLKDLLKDIGHIYKKEGLLANEDLAFIFDARKNKIADGQKEVPFLLKQVDILREFNKKPMSINFESVGKEIRDKQQGLLNKYAPETWISWAAENAKNVTFATHVTKLTHSSIDSPSFFDKIEVINNRYLSTSSLKNIAIDGAVKGNQYSPIYQFLELELNGNNLADRKSVV